METQTQPAARRVLVIDDNLAIHEDFRKTLAPRAYAAMLSRGKAALFGEVAEAPAQAPGFDVEFASQGEEGVLKAQAAASGANPFAVAFVDMRMPPGIDGLQTIKQLWKADPALQVVICSAYTDYSFEQITQTLGVSDKLLILRKPFDAVEVAQLATSLSEKWRLHRKARLQLEDLESMVRLRTEQLEYAAQHDKLTGLPNRSMLLDRLSHALARSDRSPSEHFAVVFIDFDRFKLINDSLGHAAGDCLLVEVAARLGSCLRPTDIASREQDRRHASGALAARLGGDEFIVVADGIRTPADAARIAERLLRQLSGSYVLDGHDVFVTASIGITTSHVGYTSAGDMLRDADAAMYHAKSAGKARYALFDPAMHEEATARLELENDLRLAEQRGEFFIVYQPIVSLPTGVIEGFEALLRWRHPTRGVVCPVEFIPCCEESGLIVPVGLWALGVATRQLRLWQQSDPLWASLTMSVNVSVRQFNSPGFVAEVARIIAESGIDPTHLALEVTESLIIRDADNTIANFDSLRALGVHLHMDDFGTGYSSLSCLHRFPLDGLKIDRSFVTCLGERRDYAAIVNAIIDLAANLGIKLIAEGVETPDQVALLQGMGCAQAQGYLFGCPAEPAAIEALLAKRHLQAA